MVRIRELLPPLIPPLPLGPLVQATGLSNYLTEHVILLLQPLRQEDHSFGILDKHPIN